jgi:signal transduction histidine kinase
LIEINNVLETFSYTLSHDLKKPLAALQMTAQMIRDRPGLSQEFSRVLEFQQKKLKAFSKFSIGYRMLFNLMARELDCPSSKES